MRLILHVHCVNRNRTGIEQIDAYHVLYTHVRPRRISTAEEVDGDPIRESILSRGVLEIYYCVSGNGTSWLFLHGAWTRLLAWSRGLRRPREISVDLSEPFLLYDQIRIYAAWKIGRKLVSLAIGAVKDCSQRRRYLRKVCFGKRQVFSLMIVSQKVLRLYDHYIVIIDNSVASIIIKDSINSRRSIKI